MHPSGQEAVLLVGDVGDIPHRIEHANIPFAGSGIPFGVELRCADADTRHEAHLRIEIVLEVSIFTEHAP